MEYLWISIVSGMVGLIFFRVLYNRPIRIEFKISKISPIELVFSMFIAISVFVFGDLILNQVLTASNHANMITWFIQQLVEAGIIVTFAPCIISIIYKRRIKSLYSDFLNFDNERVFKYLLSLVAFVSILFYFLQIIQFFASGNVEDIEIAMDRSDVKNIFSRILLWLFCIISLWVGIDVKEKRENKKQKIFDGVNEENKIYWIVFALSPEAVKFTDN